ncbi:hypothetical protein J6S88_00510 [bacterium]|nr:hypothetical protein [bacterium]
MKKIITSLLILCAIPAFGTEISVNDIPKAPAYRFGLSDEPEVKYTEAKNKIYANLQTTQKNIDYSIDKISSDNDETGDLSRLTYADLSIKRLSNELGKDLESEDKQMLADLSLLWKGAATQSDTINYALYKLANPDEDKPDSKSIKSFLSNIAGLSSLAGATIGNPALAAGSFLGGNLLGIFSQDTKALNYKYTKVNDADMVILVRKIEELQQKTINLYYDYITSRKKVQMLEKIAKKRLDNYELSQNSPKEILLISDAYYRNAIDALSNATSEFYTNRATLEQFVGHEVFVQFEEDVMTRDKE